MRSASARVKLVPRSTLHGRRYLIPPSTSKVDTLNDLHNFMTGFIQITVETAETIKEIAKAHRAMQDQLCDGQP